MSGNGVEGFHDYPRFRKWRDRSAPCLAPVILNVLRGFLGVEIVRGGMNPNVELPFCSLWGLGNRQGLGKGEFQRQRSSFRLPLRNALQKRSILASQTFADEIGQQLLEFVACIAHQFQVFLQSQKVAVIFDVDL